MADCLLETRELTKRFDGLVAVDRVSISVYRGQHFGIIGPNGSGKTTLFNLITGFLSPTSGSVFFEGREITGLPVYERVRLGIGRTFQLVSVFDSLTVFENVVISILRLMNTRSMFSGVFFQSTSNRNVVERSKEILEEIGLYSKAEAEVRELSYGEKRMLEIALVLAQNPRILLLDEPFAGLSDYEIRKVSELIEKIKSASTLVVIEHKISKLIGIVDRLAVLNEGSLICEGEPQKVLSDENVRACYWGKEDSFCSA